MNLETILSERNKYKKKKTTYCVTLFDILRIGNFMETESRLVYV